MADKLARSPVSQVPRRGSGATGFAADSRRKTLRDLNTFGEQKDRHVPGVLSHSTSHRCHLASER